MKSPYKFVTLVVIGILIGCNSQKKASHHNHNEVGGHTHDNKPTTPDPNNHFGDYNLEDEIYGTKTNVIISGDKRIMTTNSLPNHKTGAFPNQGNPNTISEQNKTYVFPVNPVYTGKSQWIREPGIALNGVKFEPGTAEVVQCDTGENYRVEAFQDMVDLGLDFNHAHVQPTGAYHYHGSPISVIENSDSGEDLVHVGYAHDGFPMYYSKSNAYKPSYKLVEGNREGDDCTYTNPKKTLDISVDGHHNGTYTSDFEFVEGSGDLDACNGIAVNGKYMYLVTNEFPYVSRCLMGEFEEEKRRGGQRELPNVAQIFERMDTDKDGKLTVEEIKGPLANNFSKIDTNVDGFISKNELESQD